MLRRYSPHVCGYHNILTDFNKVIFVANGWDLFKINAIDKTLPLLLNLCLGWERSNLTLNVSCIPSTSWRDFSWSCLSCLHSVPAQMLCVEHCGTAVCHFPLPKCGDSTFTSWRSEDSTVGESANTMVWKKKKKTLYGRIHDLNFYFFSRWETSVNKKLENNRRDNVTFPN